MSVIIGRKQEKLEKREEKREQDKEKRRKIVNLSYGTEIRYQYFCRRNLILNVLGLRFETRNFVLLL